VGLALESNVSINRNICVTNKTFAYLMAGLAIIGTDTQGQKDIFGNFGEAALLCKSHDPSTLGAAMLHFILNPDRLATAKQAARIAALDRFNWENESQKLFQRVTKALQ
jgi:glycosyltransferase involved in cell wall biosynthesis